MRELKKVKLIKKSEEKLPKLELKKPLNLSRDPSCRREVGNSEAGTSLIDVKLSTSITTEVADSEGEISLGVEITLICFSPQTQSHSKVLIINSQGSELLNRLREFLTVYIY